MSHSKNILHRGFLLMLSVLSVLVACQVNKPDAEQVYRVFISYKGAPDQTQPHVFEDRDSAYLFVLNSGLDTSVRKIVMAFEGENDSTEYIYHVFRDSLISFKPTPHDSIVKYYKRNGKR